MGNAELIHCFPFTIQLIENRSLMNVSVDDAFVSKLTGNQSNWIVNQLEKLSDWARLKPIDQQFKSELNRKIYELSLEMKQGAFRDTFDQFKTTAVVAS